MGKSIFLHINQGISTESTFRNLKMRKNILFLYLNTCIIFLSEKMQCSGTNTGVGLVFFWFFFFEVKRSQNLIISSMSAEDSNKYLLINDEPVHIFLLQLGTTVTPTSS